MPAWIIELFRSNYEAFAANPLLFALVIFAGAFLGFLFSKLIHKGKIDALEERIKLKGEQIEVKDKTIESMSKDRSKLELAISPQTTPPLPQPPAPEIKKSKDAFAAANANITKTTERKLQNLILHGIFKFVFNPASGGSKNLTFLTNGEIGQGRNHNEYRWRIADGRLEIINGDGAVYSRFVLLDDDQSLHHTNDPDTLSIRGQYLKLIAISSQVQ